jgi:N-methylhydantoinase A
MEEDITSAFHSKHKQLYGYSMPDEPLELVNARLQVVYGREKPLPRIGKAGKNRSKGEREVHFHEGSREVDVYFRENLSPGFEGQGPIIVEENTSTTVIPPDVIFKVDRYGLIHMEVN